MIRVTCTGHIGASLGKEELDLDETEIGATQLIERLKQMARDEANLGFTEFNTIMILNDGEAFIPASKDRLLRDGDSVVLVPFSHGG
jgi:molybdopterin converting factor small subunit